MSSSPKVCYNPECNNPTPKRPREGWRLKSGDLAALCDRCASTYDEGRFCETFHSRASGWRHCDSCGKRIHCGCIISSHVFVLLDSGGVECLMCARKNVVVTSYPSWLPSLIPLSERLKEASMRNWCQSAGSGPMPWRQGSTLFSYSITEPEMLPRVPPEVDKFSVVDKFNISEQFPAPLLEKKTIENFPQNLMNGCLNFGAPEVYKKGNSHGEHHNLCLNISRQCSPLKEDLSIPQFGLTVPCTSANETSGQIGVFGIHSRPSPPSSLTKQLHGNLRSGVDLLGKTQTHYGNSQGYFRERNQLLSRYWPRITDQELKQISGDSKSVITPLFEKTLSASDAGRIGRLVLPKKFAEAYFPRISQPEGFPLNIQDMKGKEWTFQFRFWPNNNSRMYVLEGVTPCIQSMQLQAGDIVIFSRLEPEGKLVMGFRKGCAAPTDQNNVTAKTGNGVTTTRGDVELADPRSLEKVNEVGCIAKDTLGAKSPVSSKRKNSALVPMNNCLRNENEDQELKLTLEEAQGLLQPPPEHIPSVVVIEGFEFEEYENAPVLGKPRICAADKTGEMVRWVQCEICFKWRKLPLNVLLPPRWTCFDNPWDAERLLCSTAQTSEQLENVLPSGNSGTSKKLKADLDNVEVSEALDGLGNLAVLGYGEAISSSQATTKHPRHRPECSCIQPPNGKGHQHKQTVERREKNQSEKEAQDTREQPRLVERLLEDDDDDAPLPLSSPFKGQIDLNIQPEREEQVSPGPHPKLLKDCNKQQKSSSSICNLEEISNELSADEVRTATSH